MPGKLGFIKHSVGFVKRAPHARELDTFVMEKDGVASELADMVDARAKTLGVELIAVGIRDVILQGELKDLMNKVTEAKKDADSNLAAKRRPPCAASQTPPSCWPTTRP